MKFPKELLLDSVAAYPFNREDYDDSKSSHPNIKKRKELLDRLIANNNSSGEKLNALQNDRFKTIQRLAQRELVHLDLLNRQYYDAMINALILLKKNPNDRFLEESIAKALYGIAKYSGGNGSNIGSDMMAPMAMSNDLITCLRT